ncbi:Acetyl-coenzyme A synthetase 2-like, mitochondrial [Phytophthora boehmeriae]|uniref:Acetyl-coenzyme A synthetase 2-like, mitochondrial n=1 Tax=Phytophthora boehmeriae TaxID=109152 RepID=A0A8T1XB17_9STRA|nr:Acetyl-coenzyme A synthetase 2-like, mitochondrial [Phytophthora boehmeriae]
MGDSAGVSFNGVYPVPDALAKTAHVKGMEQYEAMYKRSLEDPENFWGEMGRENLDWFRQFDQAVVGTVNKGDTACYIIYGPLANGPSKDVEKELVQQVRAHIGAFASPDLVVLVPGLPKTRSGKIMRRVLRKISHGEEDSLGDVSTLADPSVVPVLITNTKAALVGKSF